MTVEPAIVRPAPVFPRPRSVINEALATEMVCIEQTPSAAEEDADDTAALPMTFEPTSTNR